MTKKVAVGFDYSHNNKLTIENNAFTDLIQYLFDSDFKLGKIEAGITYEKLNAYDIFIIGMPHLGKLDDYEINDLVKYVNEGGSLLIINDGGGDYDNKNNLSELTKNFGIIFNSDRLFDNKNFSKDNSHPLIKNFRSHYITREIHEIIHSNGCSISIDDAFTDENNDVKAIAYSSEKTSWHRIFNGDSWIDESEQTLAVIGVAHYGIGKVIALGNLSLFSSLDTSYGIRAADNFKLIANMFSWLLNKANLEDKKIKPIFLTIAIEQDLFYWIKDMVKEGKWKNLEELINFTLKNTKNKINEGNDNID